MNRASFLQETQTVFLASKVQNNLGPSGQQNLYYDPISPVRPALTYPHAFTLAWSNSGLSIHLKENCSVFQSSLTFFPPLILIAAAPEYMPDLFLPQEPSALYSAALASPCLC